MAAGIEVHRVKTQSPWFARRLAVLVISLACYARAAAPVNDTCAGALVISNSFPYLTPVVDLLDATTNGDPQIEPCFEGVVSRSVWYRFTPLVTADYTISTCTDTATTLLDTVMAIYTASGACNGFSLLACVDDDCGLRAAMAERLNAGTTYYIVVWNNGNTIFSSGTTVQLRVSPPPPVPNDLCAGALAVPGAGPFPYLTPVSDTRLAGVAGDPPVPACATPVGLDRSVWFRFTPAASGKYNFSLCGDTATTVYDTFLAIYQAASCSGPFTRIACNDDHCTFQSALTTNLVAGTTYYIVAWDPDPDRAVGESLIQLRVAGTVPRITSGRRLLDGSYELRFNVNFAQRYTVEAASDLLSLWSSIGTITNGSSVFVDTNAAPNPRRFYRLSTP